MNIQLHYITDGLHYVSDEQVHTIFICMKLKPSQYLDEAKYQIMVDSI